MSDQRLDIIKRSECGDHRLVYAFRAMKRCEAFREYEEGCSYTLLTFERGPAGVARYLGPAEVSLTIFGYQWPID
jgi:hypothetical protein